MRQDCPLPPGSVVWLYCRHSPGDEQDIGSQIRAGKAYCETHGLVIDHIFQDIARPGWTIAGRDEFEAMRLMAERTMGGTVRGILFWSFSRLFRDINLAQYHLAGLRLLGYAVFSITEVIPDGPEGLVVETLIHYLNQKDIEKKREDITRGLHDRVQQGYSAGGSPPFGYLAEKVKIGIKSSGAPKYGTVWIPHPANFPLAKRAWEMRAKGATYAEIHKAIPGVFSDSRSWHYFFKCKTYLGVMTCGDIEIPDRHLPVCTREQWDIVQAMKPQEKAGGWPRRKRSPFLLSGLGRCSYCGWPISGGTSNPNRPNRWRYYYCSQKGNRGWTSCESRCHGVVGVDSAVVGAVLDEVLTPAGFEELVEAVNERLADQTGLDLEIQAKEQELARCAETVKNLGYAVTRGSLSLTGQLLEEEKRQARLETELKRSRELAAAEILITDESEVAAELDELRAGLSLYDSGPEAAQQARRILQSFVSHITVGDRGGVIHYHLPLVLQPSYQLHGILPLKSVEFEFA